MKISRCVAAVVVWTWLAGCQWFLGIHDPEFDAPTLDWAKRAGGPQFDSAVAVSPLADGSVVVAGSFADTATFGPGEAHETDLTTVQALDVFVARYAADGTLDWVKSAGGFDDDRVYALSTFADGSFAITGGFRAEVTFGPGEDNQTVLTSAGGWDVFVARYEADGRLRWAKRAGGSGDDTAKGLGCLPDGSCVVGGAFSGQATFGPGEDGSVVLESTGETELFVARYEPDGTIAWASQAGSHSYDDLDTLAAFADGSVVVGGIFKYTAIFGAGEEHETSLTVAEDDTGDADDGYLARYNADGTLAWATRLGGGGWDAVERVASLGDGSTIAIGHFEKTATFDPGAAGEQQITSAGGKDLFLARYDAGGNLSWVKRAGGTADDWQLCLGARADGAMVIGGQLIGSATFGAGGAGEEVLTASTGQADLFVAFYHPDGTFAAATQAGPMGTTAQCTGAAFSSPDTAIISGSFTNTATFGADEANERPLTAAGNTDAFVASYYLDW